MNPRNSRRQFFQRSALAAGGLYLGGSVVARSAGFLGIGGKSRSPNDKLNIGVIGLANRGAANLKGVEGENIVAICDVDATTLGTVGERFPKAKRFTDFRKMIDYGEVEAVVVSTPDHNHAVATSQALQSGHHVYCEKPLTHTVSEARRILELSRKYPELATQMGNQIHSSNNYRRVVELVQAGTIGDIAEVHVWAAAVYQGKTRPIEIVPVPATLDYDQWLGPAHYRPYHPSYLPHIWRNWWVFGGGTMADFGCHYMDLPHWALNLRYPDSVETQGPPVHPEGPPTWMTAEFKYPAREGLPPVTLHWYQGEKKPPLIAENKVAGKWPSGVLFVGQKGMLLSDYTKHVLLPENDWKGFEPPAPFIPDSIGHHAEWIQACKTGGGTGSCFEYATALTETIQLGNVAYRVGKKIDWDAVNLKARNCPEADQFIQHNYRSGWKI